MCEWIKDLILITGILDPALQVPYSDWSVHPSVPLFIQSIVSFLKAKSCSNITHEVSIRRRYTATKTISLFVKFILKFYIKVKVVKPFYVTSLYRAFILSVTLSNFTHTMIQWPSVVDLLVMLNQFCSLKVKINSETLSIFFLPLEQ